MFGHYDSIHKLGGDNCNGSVSMVGRRNVDYVPVSILISKTQSDILTMIIKHPWTVYMSTKFHLCLCMIG